MHASLQGDEYAYGTSVGPRITLFFNNTLVTSASVSLLYTLQPGFYTLLFTHPGYVGDGVDGVISVELAINTVLNLRNEVALYPNSDCPTQMPSAIATSPTGYYYGGSSLSSISTSDLAYTTEFAGSPVPFALTRFSLVYLQLGFNFLLSEFVVSIHQGSVTNPSLVVTGAIRRNTNVIHIVCCCSCSSCCYTNSLIHSHWKQELTTCILPNPKLKLALALCLIVVSILIP